MAVDVVDFHRTKYGPELLIDVAYIHAMPTFLRDLAPHSLTFYDITLVTAGRGSYWLDHRRYPVRPGMLYFTSPGQIRRWQVDALDGVCLFFSAEFVTGFFSDPLFLQRLRFFHNHRDRLAVSLSRSSAASLERELQGMIREIGRLRPDSSHLLRARLYETLVRLHRLFVPGSGGLDEVVLGGVVLRFRQLLERRYQRCHRVAEYAGELGVTPGHLNHLVRRQLGASASRVIRDRIVVEAKRLLLHSDRTAAGVGYALGFRDPAYFTRFFRRETGASPTRYRRHRAAGAAAEAADAAGGPGAR